MSFCRRCWRASSEVRECQPDGELSTRRKRLVRQISLGKELCWKKARPRRYRMAARRYEIRVEPEKRKRMAGAHSESKLPKRRFNIRTPITPAQPSREVTFRNYYRCPNDGATWHDDWSCRCNDRCPTCRAEIEPYESEDI